MWQVVAPIGALHVTCDESLVTIGTGEDREISGSHRRLYNPVTALPGELGHLQKVSLISCQCFHSFI
jgi:hypothetical protein